MNLFVFDCFIKVIVYQFSGTGAMCPRSIAQSIERGTQSNMSRVPGLELVVANWLVLLCVLMCPRLLAGKYCSSNFIGSERRKCLGLLVATVSFRRPIATSCSRSLAHPLILPMNNRNRL